LHPLPAVARGEQLLKIAPSIYASGHPGELAILAGAAGRKTLPPASVLASYFFFPAITRTLTHEMMSANNRR
jgi:hypothetical protein